VAASLLEGLDEILTVIRLGLPAELRRSLACTNIVENMMGTVRRVCRNVKRWQDASMALRWTSAAMLEAAKGFRRLKAPTSNCGQPSQLTRPSMLPTALLNRLPGPRNLLNRQCLPSEFQQKPGHPPRSYDVSERTISRLAA
jgi:hypothetical protein